VVIPYTLSGTPTCPRRYRKVGKEIATIWCLESQKSAYPYIAAEFWNHNLNLVKCHGVSVYPATVSTLRFEWPISESALKHLSLLASEQVNYPNFTFLRAALWDAIEKNIKRFVLSLLEEDAVDLHCTLATTCGEIIQILSKILMYHCRSFFHSLLFGYVVSRASHVGWPLLWNKSQSDLFWRLPPEELRDGVTCVWLAH